MHDNKENDKKILPLITVVTVVYNSEATIVQTIESVIQQTYPNIEYIIIDGQSKDHTLDIIKMYGNRISQCISEPDGGIYDAMNKAIDRATGQWICFMNSGDRFHDVHVVENIFSNKEYTQNVGVIYGDTHLVNEDSYVGEFKNIPFWTTKTPFRHGKGICHQSMFTRVDLAKKNKFDLKYKISADFDMAYKIFKDKYQYCYVPLVVSDFDTSGVSCSKEHWKIAYKETGQILGCRYNPLYWMLYFYKSLKNKK